MRSILVEKREIALYRTILKQYLRREISSESLFSDTTACACVGVQLDVFSIHFTANSAAREWN